MPERARIALNRADYCTPGRKSGPAGQSCRIWCKQQRFSVLGPACPNHERNKWNKSQLFWRKNGKNSLVSANALPKDAV